MSQNPQHSPYPKSEAEFMALVEDIQADNNKPLERIFMAYYDVCTYSLKRTSSCDEDTAKDIFMDALLALRRNILANRVSYTSPSQFKAYILKICKNIYLKQLRDNRENARSDYDIIEFLLSKEKGLAKAHINPLIAREESEQLQQQIYAVRKALTQLKGKCGSLLTRFYINGERLKDMWQDMGYSSHDTIRTTKGRCFKKLCELVKRYT